MSLRIRWLAMIFAALLVPMRSAMPAIKTTSFKLIASSDQFKEYQLILSDVSGSIAGSDPTSAGESVATGDWSQAVPAAGWKGASLDVHEYGSGSISVSLWDCRRSGATGVISGVDSPAVEDPASAPSAADPDPLCVRLVAGVDGVGVASDGDAIEITGHTFHNLIARIDTCTGNCDAQISLQLTR